MVLGAGALIEYLRTVKLLYKNESHRRLLQPNKEAGLVGLAGAVKSCHVILLGAGKRLLCRSKPLMRGRAR